MKNILKGMILIAFIIAITFVMPGLMDSTEYTIQAGEAEWTDDGSSTGVEAFTVVEIVPYRGMAEIGYLVGGEEPVDQELMPYNSAQGLVSFLGGAISVYRSYTESALPASGVADNDWYLARTIANQNGYFENVGNNNGGRYKKTTGDNYVRVANGTGTYRVELVPGDMETVYTGWEPTNRKNVEAYFVYGKPSGVALYNSTIGYEPYSVTENTTHTGDYDYDSETGRFYLNKGYGLYNVIFVRSYSSNLYYMRNDYQIVDDNSGDYSFQIQYVAQSGGNYTRESETLYTYDRWNGIYRWTQNDDALTKPSNHYIEGTKFWVRNQKVMKEYQFTYKTQLVNNEWFKRLTLGIPSNQIENYPVEVITITPDELNLEANQHYIEDADMFYLNANYGHNQSYITLYEEYSYEGLNLPYASKYDDNQNSKKNNLNFAVHDLSWPSVEKVFKRIAGIGCDKASMVVDSTFYGEAINGQGAYAALSKSVTVSYSYNSNKATMCNLAKLYIMVYQRNMVDFYNSFMNPNKSSYLIEQVASTINRTGATGSFVRPSVSNPKPADAIADVAIYWNGNTFLPYGLDETGTMVSFAQADLVAEGIVNYNITATPTDLTNNVLSIGGSDIFTSKFIQPLKIPTDSQEDAVVHLSSLNEDGTVVTTGSITLGNLTNVISNNGVGYEETGGVSYPDGNDVEGAVVEDPVGDTEDGSGGSGLRSYKRVLNIQPTADFTSSEVSIRAILSSYDVQIVNMTSTQFNGSIEDINAIYDMVFMGSGFGRFNLASNKTVFNTMALNTYFYFTPGDMIGIKDGKRETDYYQDNDITTQKKSDLESFLAAGYPIVLDSGMYQRTGVKSGTNMYTFIAQAKTTYSTNVLNHADYSSTTTSTKISFIVKLRSALNVTRPIINLINPILAESSAVNYTYVDPDTDLLKIKFALVPKGTFPSQYTYNAYLYVDENSDGIFDETEKLNVVTSGGSSWVGLKENSFKTYTYSYDMANLNGVYQWKLVIKRSDNEVIRSTVTGYAANTIKNNVYILHIRENATAYNLENEVNDSASLINQFAGLNELIDYNIIFDTLTVSEFQQLYATTPYTTATKATTNKLSKYHMLILDNPITAISVTNGALNNIKDEIALNLSVIYTKDALGYSNQSSYYATTKTSFLDERTYNYINRYALTKYKGNNQYLIYNSLSTNGNVALDTTYETTFLTKTNEGTITRYPYQISQVIQTPDNAKMSYSFETPINFNLSANQKLIGWYCLSDSKSPVVRKAVTIPGAVDADLYKGMYSTSPNDVKSNYYLFSYGLCYYSGITLAKADVPGNNAEIMLFVNTIIAAHKASSRTVSNPPVITITKPVPVGTDIIKTITVIPENIEGTDFILTFAITDSSSQMDLKVLLDNLEPAGNWNDNVYEVALSGTLGPAIGINNTSKLIANKTYALKIPISEIIGNYQLSINAKNEQGNDVTTKVNLIYFQKPIVTIVDPVPITNTTTGYLYIDIDYNALDTDESYLDLAQEFRVVFKVETENPDTGDYDVLLSVTSELDSLTDGLEEDVSIYPIDAMGVEGTRLNLTQATPIGQYAMYIPVSLLKDHNSRELIIKATDTIVSVNAGQVSITLIRRSLFPLD